MLDSPLFPVFALAGLAAGAFCFLRSVSRWEKGLELLFLVMIFGGIITVRLGSGVYSILFRDVFIVLPLYAGLFSRRSGQEAIAQIPADLALALMLLLIVVFICTLNPVDAPVGQILIGIKVWLYYLPLVAVGIAVSAEPEAMLRMFRALFFIGGAGCAIGLLQSLLIHVLGYDAAIQMFFGGSAAQVTQGFASFEEAGGIFRIPGTFSFTAQYGYFLFAYLPVTIIVSHIDPNRSIRKLASIAVYLTVVAGILSGTRAAILVFPAMLGVCALFGVLSARLIAFAPLGLGAAAAAIAFSGIDLTSYFSYGEDIASEYGHNFIFQQISDSLDYGLLGAGVGAATGGARYAMGGDAVELGTALGFESYFAKAAAELGWLGLGAVSLLFTVIALRMAILLFRNWRRPENAIVAPISVYLGVLIVTSFKAWPFDTDPGNVFSWLFLGVAIGADRFSRQTWPSEEEEAVMASPVDAGEWPALTRDGPAE
jgi:hypothetical protein